MSETEMTKIETEVTSIGQEVSEGVSTVGTVAAVASLVEPQAADVATIATSDQVADLKHHVSNIFQSLVNQISSVETLVRDIKGGNYTAATSDGTSELLSLVKSAPSVATDAEAVAKDGEVTWSQVQTYFSKNFHLFGTSTAPKAT